jgi:protein associated with RNAse G/E
VYEEKKVVQKRGRGRLKKNIAFLIIKKRVNFNLTLKLRQEGTISTLRVLFEQVNKKEVEGLVIRRVFAFK